MSIKSSSVGRGEMLHRVPIGSQWLIGSYWLILSHRAPGKLIFERQYMNCDFPTFNDVVRRFLEESGISKPPITACLAVAGPVYNNSVEFTNRKEWKIVGEAVARTFGIRTVRLINDFVAVGYGLLTLNEDTECITLQVNLTVGVPAVFF